MNKQSIKNSGSKRRLRKGRVAVLILLVLLVVTVAVGLAYIGSIIASLPDWDEQMLIAEQTTFLYDKNGEEFNQLHRAENRVPITIDQLPPYFIDCLLANEDTRFYEHFGVDVKRVFGALFRDVLSASFKQGASTITMQLARNAILEDGSKEISRKLKETFLAIELEKHYSKDEILNMYINEVFWGHQAYGIQAASHFYFNKDAADLTLGESAALVGMLPAPNAYSPFNDVEKTIAVRDKALAALNRYSSQYSDMIEKASQEELTINEGAIENDYKYPWFTDNVIDEASTILADLGMDANSIYTGGLKIYTTLDPVVQNLMEEAYAKEDNFPDSSTLDPVQSAMAVLDVKTGNIAGLIGGREHTTLRGLNRAVDIQRQPGSSFKPIAAYAPALEAGYGTGSVANDVLTTFGGTYTPKNYDGTYRGVISMRTALQYSINIVAVKFLQKVGPEEGFAMAKKLGIDLDENNDKNLSMALGGLTKGVSPLEMAAAYASFGNSGIYSKPVSILKIENSSGKVLYEATPQQTVAMSESTAYMISDMLKTVTTAGTGTRARLNRPVASKTGTTQLPDKPDFKGKIGNKDAWFAAYTTDYVGVVWMGYDEDEDANGKPQYLKQIYGGRYPALIWKYVVGGASDAYDLPVKDFTKPSDVTSVKIDAKSGLLPGENTPDNFIVTELFKTSDVPTEQSNVWKSVLICPETGLLATDFCPNAVMKALFTPPAEKNQIIGTGADKAYILPTTYCTLHTQPQQNTIPDDQIIPEDPSDNQTDDPDINENDDDIPVSTSLLAPTNIKYDIKSTKNNTRYTVIVSWDKPKNSTSTTYEVERWTSETKDSPYRIESHFSDIADSGLTAGTYYYRVRCVSKDGDLFSPWSTTITVKAQAKE